MQNKKDGLRSVFLFMLFMGKAAEESAAFFIQRFRLPA